MTEYHTEDYVKPYPNLNAEEKNSATDLQERVYFRPINMFGE